MALYKENMNNWPFYFSFHGRERTIPIPTLLCSTSLIINIYIYFDLVTFSIIGASFTGYFSPKTNTKESYSLARHFHGSSEQEKNPQNINMSVVIYIYIFLHS